MSLAPASMFVAKLLGSMEATAATNVGSRGASLLRFT